MVTRDRDLTMILACLFSMSLFACGLELSGARPPYFDRRESAEEEDSEVGSPSEEAGNEGAPSEEEETYKRLRRTVRKYPEEAEDAAYRHHRHEEEHHRAFLRNHHLACDCPDTLAKGTLIAVVAASAFLFIFSSSIQLVVAVCILRLVKKQRKMEKEAKLHSHSSHYQKHLHPPVPPPRPENTYMNTKAQRYDRLYVASLHANQGVYLSATELHPGPRLSQEKRYQNIGGSPQVATNEGSPEAVASPKRRETHLYEEVE